MTRTEQAVSWPPFLGFFNQDFVQEANMTEYQISSDINERAQQREAVLDAPAVKVRDQAREKALWDHYIQPVVDEHFKGKYRYKYFDEPTIITNRDIDSMLRITMALCMDESGYNRIFPTDYFEKEVLRRLWYGTTAYTQNKEYASVDLKELFGDFLWDLFNDKTLPIYLSFLDLEYGSDGLWDTANSDSDQGQEVNIGSDPESTTVKIFPLPGTSWDQIKIRYVNDNHIEISHPGVKTHAPYSMADLGLDNKPSLEALFKRFANNRGDINGEKMGTKTVKANISNLRKHLKAIFPEVEGSPIANFSKQNGYCCNFKIS
jgi:hypothetical protein